MVLDDEGELHGLVTVTDVLERLSDAVSASTDHTV
jgi:CBS domain containing-hemolysin-like protein